MRIGDKLRTALVTGASSGLGEAFARMLVSEGLDVWGTSRSEARMAQVKPVRPVVMEASDAASVDAAWTRAETESGGIDLLVNNAGAGVFAVFATLPDEEWRRQMEILFTCPARLARLASSSMLCRKRGGIVNVTSLAVEFPIPFMAAYNSAKAALAGLSADLETQMAGRGVIVVDFRAGDFRTSFNDNMRDQSPSLAQDPRMPGVWRRLEAGIAGAPGPALAARDLRRVLLRGESGMVRSGSFFQARLAPFLTRFAPVRIGRYFQRRYFGLG